MYIYVVNYRFNCLKKLKFDYSIRLRIYISDSKHKFIQTNIQEKIGQMYKLTRTDRKYMIRKDIIIIRLYDGTLIIIDMYGIVH